MTLQELLLVVGALAILVIYTGDLTLRLRRKPDSTAIGSAALARRRWVENIFESKRDLTAIHAVRNWTMTASFMASTSILIVAGLLGFLVTSSKMSVLAQELNLLGSRSTVLLSAKIFLLIVSFFISFFCFSVALRYYNHSTLFLSIADAEPKRHDIELALSHLNRAALFLSVGIRGFFVAIPLVLWIFGPLWMLIGTIVLVAILRYLDQVG